MLLLSILGRRPIFRLSTFVYAKIELPRVEYTLAWFLLLLVPLALFNVVIFALQTLLVLLG